MPPSIASIKTINEPKIPAWLCEEEKVPTNKSETNSRKC